MSSDVDNPSKWTSTLFKSLSLIALPLFITKNRSTSLLHNFKIHKIIFDLKHRFNLYFQDFFLKHITKFYYYPKLYCQCCFHLNRNT